MKGNMDSLNIVSINAPSTTYASLATSARRGKKSKTYMASSEDDDDEVRETTPVHVCIKAKTFDLVLGSNNNTIDMRSAKVGARLVYEANGAPVERKVGELFEFDVIPSKIGRTATVELRLNVLSSQQEGALFCVHLTVEQRGKGVAVDDHIVHEITSEPIRVVSKKSQLEVTGTKKRSRTTQVATREAVLELINKMEAQMSQAKLAQDQLVAQNARQTALVETLMRRIEGTVSPTLSTTTTTNENAANRCLDMEDKFEQFLASLQSSTCNLTERNTRLGAIGRSLGPQQWTALAPLFCEMALTPQLTNTDAPPFELPSERSFLNGSLGALFNM